jgi:hypothetical protein
MIDRLAEDHTNAWYWRGWPKSPVSKSAEGEANIVLFGIEQGAKDFLSAGRTEWPFHRAGHYPWLPLRLATGRRAGAIDY